MALCFISSQLLHLPSYCMLPFFDLIVTFLLTEHVGSAGGLQLHPFFFPLGSLRSSSQLHKFGYTPRFIFSVALAGKIHLIAVNCKQQLLFISLLLTVKDVLGLWHPSCRNEFSKLIVSSSLLHY